MEWVVAGTLLVLEEIAVALLILIVQNAETKCCLYPTTDLAGFLFNSSRWYNKKKKEFSEANYATQTVNRIHTEVLDTFDYYTTTWEVYTSTSREPTHTHRGSIEF